MQTNKSGNSHTWLIQSVRWSYLLFWCVSILFGRTTRRRNKGGRSTKTQDFNHGGRCQIVVHVMCSRKSTCRSLVPLVSSDVAKLLYMSCAREKSTCRSLVPLVSSDVAKLLHMSCARETTYAARLFHWCRLTTPVIKILRNLDKPCLDMSSRQMC
jgi:hypothetical protein